jgi:hypothetical protein
MDSAVRLKLVFAAAVAAAMLAGCAASGEHAENFYVAPGKYVLYDCTQLAGTAARLEERDRELTRLMARAKESPGGDLVSAMAYDADYYSNLGELHDVRREQADKKCPSDMKAPPLAEQKRKKGR